MDWPALAPLIFVAIPIVAIFIALGILRYSRIQAGKAVRSEEYWTEQENPDREPPQRYAAPWDPHSPGEPLPRDVESGGAPRRSDHEQQDTTDQDENDPGHDDTR